MHVVTFGLDLVSIYTKTQEMLTVLPLYGVYRDEIVNKDELQASINRLIEKHEADYGVSVQDVMIVCEVLGHQIVKTPKLHNLQIAGKIVTNSFQMKVCKIYEVFNEVELKGLIACFVNIGINVERVCSFFGIFVNNVRNLIDLERIGMMHIAKGITLYIFDGAGSLKDIYTINKGLDDIIQYITLSTVAKFPHLTKRAVALILQNFICFNELDMIEKIHNVKGINKELMAVVNYETVKFISNLLMRYLRQIWADLNPPISIKKMIVYSQKDFMKNIVFVLQMIASCDVIAMKKEWIFPSVSEKSERKFFEEIRRIFF